MFARLLFESFRRGRRAKLLALGAVTLGTLAATALAVLLLGSGDQLARTLATYGANIRVLPDDGADTLPVAELAGLDETFWRNNIVAVAPLLELRVRFRASPPSPRPSPPARGERAPLPAGAPGADGVVAPVVGTWFDHPLAAGRTGLPATRPSLPVAGRWPADDANEVALGRRLAAALGAVPGDRLRLELAGRRTEARVVGLVAGGGEEEDAGFAPIALVQELAGRPGQMAAAEVAALTVPEPDFQRKSPEAMDPEEFDAWYCTAYPSAVALSVDEGLPSGRADVVRQVAGTTGAVLLRLRVVLLALAAVALLGAFLGVASAMSATVQGRSRELALLAALGSERGWIARFLVAEAGVLGLAGGILGGFGGLAAGRALAGLLFDLPGEWTPVLLPFAVALGLAVAVAGTLGPLAGVLRQPPALTLGGALASSGRGLEGGRA
jgi:putative ABC transport system permease protein